MQYALLAQRWHLHYDSALYYLDTAKNYKQANSQYTFSRNLLPTDSFSSSTYLKLTNGIATTYRMMGDLDNAIQYYSESHELIQLGFGKNSVAYANASNNLGNILVANDQFLKAEVLLLEAWSIFRDRLPLDSADFARTCNSLANFYRETNQYEKAEPFAIQAYQIRKQVLGRNDPAVAISATNLANLYVEFGQYEKAETLYLEARDIRGKAKTRHSTEYAAATNILGDLYYQTGKYDKAEDLYKIAKQIRDSLTGNDSNPYAESCHNLANVYREQKKFEAALKLYTEAQRIWEKNLDKDHLNHFLVQNNIGLLYMQKGDAKLAMVQFRKAFATLQEILEDQNDYRYTEVQRNMANANRNLKKPNLAFSFYRKVFESECNQILSFFRFTSENEKEKYLKQVNGSIEEFYSYCVQFPDTPQTGLAYDMALFSRSLILQSGIRMRKAVQQQGNASTDTEYDNWISARKRLGNLLVMYDDEMPEEAKALEDSVEKMEKNLTRMSAGFQNSMKQIRWQEIRQQLKKDETAIEFIHFPYFNGRYWTDSVLYAVLILRKEYKYPKFIQLFEEKQLLKLQNAKSGEFNKNLFRGAIVSGPEQLNLSSEIYKLVWKPIEKYLHGVNKVFVIPSGELQKISFAVLRKDSAHLIIDEMQIVNLYTSASILSQNINYEKESQSIQLYGGIQYDRTLQTEKKPQETDLSNQPQLHSSQNEKIKQVTIPYLIGTEMEVDTIKLIAKQSGLAVDQLKGNDATEESVYKLQGKSSPDILHIATHGFFFPKPINKPGDSIKPATRSRLKFENSANPMFRSGLLFANAAESWSGGDTEDSNDGILTSYEISNLNFENTRLVVLSACETALGDIQGDEGVFGLQRAFRLAGSEYLLMSLWEVPDHETSVFMQLFYRKYLSGIEIEEAFQSSIRIMRENYKDNPVSWAAWLLIH